VRRGQNERKRNEGQQGVDRKGTGHDVRRKGEGKSERGRFVLRRLRKIANRVRDGDRTTLLRALLTVLLRVRLLVSGGHRQTVNVVGIRIVIIAVVRVDGQGAQSIGQTHGREGEIIEFLGRQQAQVLLQVVQGTAVLGESREQASQQRVERSSNMSDQPIEKFWFLYGFLIAVHINVRTQAILDLLRLTKKERKRRRRD
jgi:hypothetical protein